ELDHDIIKSFVNNANRINIKYQNIDPEEDQQNLNLVSNSNNTSFPGLNDGNCFKINNAIFYKGSRENVEITSSFARLSFSELDQELVLDCRQESDGTIKELNNSLRYQCVDNSILLGGYKGGMTNNQFVIVKDSNDSIFSIDRYMFFDDCASEARGFKPGEHYNFYCANLDECIDALKNDDVRPAERIHTLFEDVDKFPGSNSQQARRSELRLDINYSQYYDVPDNWFEQTKPESFEGDREKLIALLEDQELGGLSFDLDQINDRSDTLLTNGCDTVTFRFVEDDSALQVTCEENDSECESNLVTRANTLYFNYGNKYYFEKTESRQSCSGEYVNNATYNVTYHHSSGKFIFPDSLPNPNDLPLPPSVTNTNDLFTPGLDLPYYANGFNFYGMRTFEFYDLEGNLINSMDSQVLTSQFSSNFAYTFFLFNSNEACLTFNFTPLGFDDATPNLLALALNAFIFEPSGLSKIVISDATCSKIELLIDYNNRDVLECEDWASAFEL
ncbi:hypothetical protein HOJ01_04415, partial [bacterium]|nr:hypothetical protein [bacterium]